MNKRFLLAYKLPEKAAEITALVSQKLSANVGTADPHRRIPPHITLKSPFTAGNKQLSQLKDRLTAFTSKQKPGKIIIDGFGNFNKRVVYRDGQADEVARNTIDDLSDLLETIDWLELDDHDKHVVLHTTVARARSDAEFQEILSYCKENFNLHEEMVLDSISLLHLDKKVDQWKTAHTFYPDE